MYFKDNLDDGVAAHHDQPRGEAQGLGDRRDDQVLYKVNFKMIRFKKKIEMSRFLKKNNFKMIRFFTKQNLR